MTIKTVLKIAVIVALAATAVAIFLKREHFAEDAAPDDAGSKMTWFCPTCKKGFELTARAYESQMRFGLHPSSRDGTGGKVAKSVPIVPCTFCKGWAVRGVKCPKDDTYFDATRNDAGKVVCPKCGWDRDVAGRG